MYSWFVLSVKPIQVSLIFLFSFPTTFAQVISEIYEACIVLLINFYDIFADKVSFYNLLMMVQEQKSTLKYGIL